MRRRGDKRYAPATIMGDDDQDATVHQAQAPKMTMMPAEMAPESMQLPDS